jgi:Fe-S cluster biogenesis protein NfuA
MTDIAAKQYQDHREIAEFVANNVSSALANHLGGVEVVSVDENHVRLQMVASCSTCYFRRGCIDSLVIPEIEERFGPRIKVTVR